MRYRPTSGAEASGLIAATGLSSGRHDVSRTFLERVIPHFERYPLLSGKRLDFERFASVCRLMADGAHRSRAGLIEIIELARAMNSSGRRRYDAEELLASLRQGEGIVCASGNRG